MEPESPFDKFLLPYGLWEGKWYAKAVPAIMP